MLNFESLINERNLKHQSLGHFDNQTGQEILRSRIINTHLTLRKSAINKVINERRMINNDSSEIMKNNSSENLKINSSENIQNPLAQYNLVNDLRVDECIYNIIHYKEIDEHKLFQSVFSLRKNFGREFDKVCEIFTKSEAYKTTLQLLDEFLQMGESNLTKCQLSIINQALWILGLSFCGDSKDIFIILLQNQYYIEVIEKFLYFEDTKIIFQAIYALNNLVIENKMFFEKLSQLDSFERVIKILKLKKPDDSFYSEGLAFIYNFISTFETRFDNVSSCLQLVLFSLSKKEPEIIKYSLEILSCLLRKFAGVGNKLNQIGVLDNLYNALQTIFQGVLKEKHMNVLLRYTLDILICLASESKNLCEEVAKSETHSLIISSLMKYNIEKKTFEKIINYLSIVLRNDEKTFRFCLQKEFLTELFTNFTTVSPGCTYQTLSLLMNMFYIEPSLSINFIKDYSLILHLKNILKVENSNENYFIAGQMLYKIIKFSQENDEYKEYVKYSIIESDIKEIIQNFINGNIQKFDKKFTNFFESLEKIINELANE